MAKITTGDDIALPVYLEKKINDKYQPFIISNEAIIKAVLTDLKREPIVSPLVIINKSAPGTDLNKSLVIVEFSASESAAITQLGELLLVVKVADPKKTTFSGEIKVVKGVID